MTFLDIGIIDIIDIFVVAYLLYQFYKVIRGTVAINISAVIFAVYLVWLIVKALDMQLLSTILGHVMGVGIIAIFIVFQQEIRRFLLMLSNRYSNINFSIESIFSFLIKKKSSKIILEQIVLACENMQKKKCGALIIIPQKSNLKNIAETGELIDAITSAQLIETIFFHNSPLHDGAVIISEDKIVAGSCVLPLTERTDLPNFLGLRHRAAIGITENTDALAIVVSEERGHISYGEFGKLNLNVTIQALTKIIKDKFEL